MVGPIARVLSRRHGPAFWLGLLLLFNTGLVGITIVGVRAQPPDVATLLASGDDCDSPCWLGIQPGVTRITTANGLLARAGVTFKVSPIGLMGAIAIQAPRGWLNAYLYPGFGGFRADNRIALVCLKDDAEHGSLLLGELLSALGTPDEVRLGRPEGTRVRFAIRYRARQIEAATVLNIHGARLTPSTPVEVLCFLPSHLFAPSQPKSSDLVLDWRGATSILRYHDGPPFSGVP